jgi:nucleotide-binding universal stress UspA family protein
VPPTINPTESTTAGAATQMTGPTTSEEFNISLYQEELEKRAEKMDTDLTVIATHGASGWQHMMCGAVLEKVVRRSKRNVLTVDTEADKK